MNDLTNAQMQKVAEPDILGNPYADGAKANFPAVFKHNVAAHPNKPAIVTITQSVTYAELNMQATRIAAMLLSYTGPHAEPVALLFDQEIIAFAATIGVLQSGNFYITLDPLYPPARLAEILADSGATTLLTSDRCSALAHQLCPEEVTIKNVERLAETVAKIPSVSIAPDTYAYIGYTSGSTGKAKGVIETHRNHLCHWQNLMRAQPLYGEERVLFLNRLSFSGGQLAFYLTFLAGATLYLYDLQEDGIAQLSDWIAKEQITVWNSVPTVFRTFVAHVTTPQQVASIRLLRLASDTILAQDIDAYHRLFEPTCQLWFCYALTEAKTVTMTFLDREMLITPTEIPSGRAIDGMEIRIVDEDGQPLGPHEIGEIIVRSRYVSPGYWGSPALTAERFQPDPSEPGVYLLRTGDLGKVDEQGCLYHKGRQDTQVKIRGYRVELSEIEAHLAALPDVREAAVRTYTTADGDVRLAAYLVGKKLPPSSQLRQLLGARLPTYMIPNSFSVLERMPVNRNGKIDRAALLLPSPQQHSSEMAVTTPSTPLESTLVTIWQAVFGITPIGIHDNFFELGGHSLMALTLFERIANTTGKRLPLSVVLHAPTIAQQAVLLQESSTQPQWSSVVAVRASGSRPPLFLVPPAYGTALSFIKLAHYLDPEQPVYAFDPVGLDGTASPLATVEAMAAHYIATMRTVQPQGPYRIGGKCMGGHVALEMAHQLLAQGSTVASLVILDASAPYNGPTWQWTPYHRTPRHFWKRLRVRIATRTLGIAVALKWHEFKYLFIKRDKTDEQLRVLNKAHKTAQTRYQATPNSQHIFLVQSEEYARKALQNARWSSLAHGGLTLRVVAGATHRSMLSGNEEQTRQLAYYLQEYLDGQTSM